MRAFRLLIGLLLLLPILIWAGGHLLNEDYQAGVKLTLDAPPDLVWAELLDYEENPVTGRMFQKAEGLPPVDGLPSWRETISGSTVLVTTVESVEPERLRLRFEDEELPMLATLDITLTPSGGGTAVTAVNRTTVHSGSLYSPIFRIGLTVSRGLERGLHDYWDRVARNLNVEPMYGEGE